MSETIPLANIPEELLTESETLLAPNPDLINVIVSIAETTLEQRSDSVKDVVYQATKSVMRNPVIRPAIGSVISAIFVYYLQVYKTIICTRSANIDGPMVSEAQGMWEATLSIFDLYVEYPKDHTSRVMLGYAAKAANEIILAKVASNPDFKFQDYIGRLSTLALFSETTKDYMEPIKRKQNLPYIVWLKEFFDRAFESSDLTFIESDEQVKKITTAITKRDRVIII